MRITHGFSIVELSIVLVILGLLTGGILAGQSLISAAELRSISSDISKYTTASMAFREKYFAIPGDMNNATKFWGAVGAAGTACASGLGTAPQTCDGDGNGQVDVYLPVYGQERYRFWQHLANAGLIEGSYTGRRGSPFPASGQLDVPGENIPRTKYKDVGLVVQYSSANTFGASARNWLRIASGVHPTSGQLDGRAMPQQDAWNMDTKLDDGLPDQGRMRAYGPGGYGVGCVTVSGSGYAYVLNNPGSTNWCSMFWDMGI